MKGNYGYKKFSMQTLTSKLNYKNTEKVNK